MRLQPALTISWLLNVMSIDLEFVTMFDRVVVSQEDYQPDLGYRWENGMDTMDVLMEILGCGPTEAFRFVNDPISGQLYEQRKAWKEAGASFDWALDPDTHRTPWGVRHELDKLAL